MSVNVILPGQERKLVLVYMPPDGEPKPCYEDSLSIARDQGYLPYVPLDQKTDPNTFAPDETDADRMAREEKAEAERADAVDDQLLALGITRPANPGCESCQGEGLNPDGSIAPCYACFPEAKPHEGDSEEGAPDTSGVGDIGTDNEGAIVGAPAGTTAIGDANTPKSCTMAGCGGLCGICPPPAKVTVRQGRELNRNRRAQGLQPLRIEDGGKVRQD